MMKKYTTEQAQEIFSETFYTVWEHGLIGRDDTENSLPWGSPWYNDPAFSIDLGDPAGQATAFYKDNRSSILGEALEWAELIVENADEEGTSAEDIRRENETIRRLKVELDKY